MAKLLETVPVPQGGGVGCAPSDGPRLRASGLAAATYLAGARWSAPGSCTSSRSRSWPSVVLSWLPWSLTGRRIRATRTLTPERPVAGDEPEMHFHSQECVALARAGADAP